MLTLHLAKDHTKYQTIIICIYIGTQLALAVKKTGLPVRQQQAQIGKLLECQLDVFN